MFDVYSDEDWREKKQKWTSELFACQQHLKEVAERPYDSPFKFHGLERNVYEIKEDGYELIATMQPKPFTEGRIFKKKYPDIVTYKITFPL